MHKNYLSSTIKQFEYNRELGWKTIQKLSDDQLNWQYNDESNSISHLIRHLSSNMLSRWTNFLHSDGEKEWRNRDEEFETRNINNEQLVEAWNKGWDCLLSTLKELKEADLEKIVYIRNQGHTALEAINRQLSHYSYHVGQIVFIGKMLLNDQWQSLSIPKGQSSSFNQEMFSKNKKRGHFTDDILSKD